MEYTYQFVFWNLIATSIWISLRFETSFAVERPLHVSFFTLLFVGLFWSAPRRWRTSLKEDADAIAMRSRISHESPGGNNQRFSLLAFTTFRSSSALLVACVITRALILRSIILDVQCSWNGLEILIPFLLALHDCTSHPSRPTSIDTSLASARGYNIAITMIALTALLALQSFSSTPQSTYICPATNWRFFIHAIQILGLFLDFSIITAISKVVKDVESKDHLRSLGQMALTSSWILTFLACLFLFFKPEQVRWSLRLEPGIGLDLAFTSLLCANFIASTVYLLRGIRPVTVFTAVTCVLVYCSSLQRHIVDSPTRQGEFIGMAFIVLFSLTGLLRLEPNHSRFNPRSGPNGMISRAVVIIMIIITSSTLWFASVISLYPDTTNYPQQPITTLIANARSFSSAWLTQAGKSKSLKEAIVEYQRRYQIPPPPGFDKWYEFATTRNSVIIDDFDQINRDLLPFWGIPPAQLREMTAHIIDRPWAEVAGLRIFNGTTEIGKHMPPTHRWMVEGAADMINIFGQWLPDMDLAFNLNDENRVAVPWADMNTLVRAANIARLQLNQTKSMQKTFGKNKWGGRFMEPEPPFPSDLPSELFTESSLAPTFEKYGSTSCPPSSPARTQKWWKKQVLCRSCSAPHSFGLYISNWTLAGSVCHQPDLANLHGFHLSPSAFKGTNLLFPIFSQSKIPSFSDILFPSPWNYMRKVGYEEKEDVPYTEKNNTFFWRGATSEGYAIRGSWMGMQRQRYVHLSNHTLPRLLKKSRTNVNVSVSFVQEPTRCFGSDCDAEWTEFNFGGPVEWKEHWKHKYLLDVDGAGFSGRFLPFLESKSLVFRAASFRQWFEDRLTPWKHFIPLDAKAGGDLAGALTFFDGVGAEVGGTAGAGAGVEGKLEAEKIAREGGEHARKVMRKEDMEIYMFRLLLEWGRLVDDKRGELGFVI